MEQELEQLKQEIAEIKRTLKEHNHNGLSGGLVSFNDLASSIKTVIVGTELTNILASTPPKVSEQVFLYIDSLTAPTAYRLYVCYIELTRDLTTSSFTASFATSVMTVSAVASGTIRVNDRINAVGVIKGAFISSFGTGTGGTGTYNISYAVGTVGSAGVTATPSPWRYTVLT